MTRIPSSSTIKFHSRLWKRREGKYSFQYWPFRESGWNKKTVSWIFLQKNLITVYRINQSLENAIVTAPFYVLHARDTREEGGREGGGVRDRSFEKTRENGRGEKRGEVRTTTTFQRRSISIEPSRENGGKICSRGEEKGGKGGEKGGERSGEERKRSVAERMIKRGRKKEDEWQSGMESGKCALASFLFFFFSSFFFFFLFFFPPPSGRQSRFTGFLTSVANIFGVIIAWFSDARAIVNDHGEEEMARRGSGKTCRAVYDRFIRWW